MGTSTAPGSPIRDDLAAEDRWFLGSRLRVVAGAEQTNGQLTVMEQWAPSGSRLRCTCMEPRTQRST